MRDTVPQVLRPAANPAWVGGRAERRREALVGYAFVLLPMLVFLAFFIFPMLYAGYISFFDWGIRGKMDAVGLENYRHLINDVRFRAAVWNTIRYVIGVVPAQVIAGFLLALIVNQKIRARTFFRAAFYFPSLASSAAITAVAIYMFNVDGLFNRILDAVGLPSDQAWFGNPDTALQTIMGLNAWTTSGTIMLFYLAGMQAINTDVYEAAALDGAGPIRTLWSITLPLLKPTHFFVITISLITTLKLFDQAFIVSGGNGGPANSTLTVVLYLYNAALRDGSFGLAAAAGVLLFIVIFALSLLQRRLMGRNEGV